MAQFPSKIAKMLAGKRLTRGIKPDMETVQEGLEASLKVAFDYDAPKLIQVILKDHSGIEINYETAEKYWKKINV